MNMRPIATFLFLFLLIANACQEEIPNDPGPLDLRETKHFINFYQCNITTIGDKTEKNEIGFSLKGTPVINTGNNPRFDALAALHGDTLFSGMVDFVTHFFVLGEDTLRSIHVQSEAYFDEQHAEGAYVDDLLNIHYLTFKEVLASHYKEQSIGQEEPLEHFNRRTDNYLLGTRFILSFTKAPARSGSYPFTVTCTNRQGECWKEMFSIEFPAE